MEGKQYGSIVFWISEVVVIICLLIALIGIIFQIDTSVTLVHVIGFQTTIFVAIWGSVATKNFKRKEIQ